MFQNENSMLEMGKVLVLEQILKLEKTSFLNNYIIEKSFIWKDDLNTLYKLYFLNLNNLMARVILCFQTVLANKIHC